MLAAKKHIAAIFWDYASLHQARPAPRPSPPPLRNLVGSSCVPYSLTCTCRAQHPPNGKRSDEEGALFGLALKAMGGVYASAVGTTVLQIKEIPRRPQGFDGALCLFGLAADADEASIRKGLEEFGEITSCVVASRDLGHVPTVVRFATHQAAEAALKGAQWSALCAGVDTLYNERPYDKRGW